MTPLNKFTTSFGTVCQDRCSNDVDTAYASETKIRQANGIP